MTIHLPEAATEDAYEAVRDDESLLRPPVTRLLRSLGVPADGLARYPTGSLPVYVAGEHVLKLYPQVHREERVVESAVLAAVAGALPIPTPPLRATGEHDGWGYVLMGRLPGTPLTEVWPTLTHDDRDQLADRLGAALGVLHSLPVPTVDGWQPGDWPVFVATQRAGCVSRQRALGLSPALAAQIPEVLAALRPPARDGVLLHTEVIAEHLLVERVDGRWRFSGLLDFEPAMPGDPEYDFVGVGVFVARGDGRFLRRVLRAYGYADAELTSALSRRLLAWALLHYYSNVPAWADHLPAAPEGSLATLATRWFPVEEESGR